MKGGYEDGENSQKSGSAVCFVCVGNPGWDIAAAVYRGVGSIWRYFSDDAGAVYAPDHRHNADHQYSQCPEGKGGEENSWAGPR